MISKNLEGLSISAAVPTLQGKLKPPVVRLDNGLVLDDSVFETATLLLGIPGSGKTYLLDKMAKPIMEQAAMSKENVVFFSPKKDLLKYKRPGDIVVSVDAADPKACWNIFLELAYSKNPELTARDIVKSLLKAQRSESQPFWSNAAADVFYSLIMCMYKDGKEKHITYSNWHLVDFLNRVSVNPDAELSWNDLAKTRPEYFGHIADYLGDNLGQGYGIISELRTLVHDAFWGSFAAKNGQFSVIKALREGGKRILLYYDFANSSEASIRIYATLLNLLLKHSTDQDNGKRTWFNIDEGSLLPETCLVDAMSLGRESGVRIIFCLQSAQLMTRHYKEDQAKSILSLFPNIFCLKVQDSMSRQILSDRYGECLRSYSVTSPGQDILRHVEHRPVVSDYDFSMVQRKGDALCSIPALSNAPFFYRGYRKELDQ